MATETQNRDVFSAREACEFLGIQYRTLMRWIADRDLPHAKVGLILRFRRQALLQWLEKQEDMTRAARSSARDA